MLAPNPATVVPFFQPIIKSADGGVFAYEVLAREKRDGKVYSVGPYFEDAVVSDRDKLTLDMHVRELAFKAYAASGSSAKLFINLKPSWIYAQREHLKALPTLDILERYKIDPQNIVIEVTEEELCGDHDAFGKLMTEYRKAGCMLAVDDFGKGASSVERIAYITPDIIKIDRSIVQKTDTHRSFYEICEAMISFGAVSGFDLLFEGVETAFQLERCVKTGGSYLQGYIFSPARAGFEIEYDNKELLADILSIQSFRERWDAKRRSAVAAEMELAVERLCPLIPVDVEKLRDSNVLCVFAGSLPHYCVRCFVCDNEGRQLSHLYQMGAHGTVTATADASPAGFFRGLLAQGLCSFRGGSLGYLSGIYKNIATKENVVSYLHKLPHGRLLCVEIMSIALA